MTDGADRQLLRGAARWCFRRRRLVVAAWVVVLVGASVLGSAFGGTFRDEFELPGSESQEAFTLLEEEGFGSMTGGTGRIVVEAADGVNDRQVRAQVERLLTRVEDTVADAEIVGPYGPGDSGQVAPGGDIAYARVNLSDRPTSELTAAGDEIRALVRGADLTGVRIELGGALFVEEPEFSSEVVGLIAAMIILLVAFGSVLAMGLPIVTALAGIGTGIALVALFGNVMTLPTFSNQAVAMIGIGVGIDYALFIVTRYREGLRDDVEPEAATVQAVDTAGRAVLFAGTTVIIALLGLLAMGLPLIRGLAIGIALGVLITMTAALTLLPAVLGFVGRGIDRLGLPHRRRAEGAGGERSLWYRWSRVLQRRPWPALATGVVLLGVVALPVLGIRLAFADASTDPPSTTTHQAYDLIAEGFGPGANGPLLLVAETRGGGEDLAMLRQLGQRLGGTDGVASASPPIPNDDGSAAIMTVIPASAPQSEATTELVHRLRDDVIPAATAGTGTTVLVTGFQAAAVDFAEYTASRLPWFIGAVLVASFVLLTAVFRSLLVPLKAVIMNLLSVGAAYGAMVAVFQWGWLSDLFGVQPAPIAPWVPMAMFAIIFGLSMDYEIFLLTRIREDYDRRGDNATAVANGLAFTARVITAAAAIMFCVFGSFVLGGQRELRLFGFGLAIAVALDASVVRLVLVPATMELLGDRNWWMPRWLDRIMPVVHVEAGAEPGGGGGGEARSGPTS